MVSLSNHERAALRQAQGERKETPVNTKLLDYQATFYPLSRHCEWHEIGEACTTSPILRHPPCCGGAFRQSWVHSIENFRNGPLYVMLKSPKISLFFWAWQCCFPQRFVSCFFGITRGVATSILIFLITLRWPLQQPCNRSGRGVVGRWAERQIHRTGKGTETGFRRALGEE